MVRLSTTKLAQIGRLATPTAEKLGIAEGKVKDFYREVRSCMFVMLWMHIGLSTLSAVLE